MNPYCSFDIPGDPAKRRMYRQIATGVQIAEIRGGELPWRPGYFLWPDGHERHFQSPENISSCACATTETILPGDEVALNARGQLIVTARAHPQHRNNLERLLSSKGYRET